MEDLASAAFAGQHETYLNCVGPAQILDRIKACFLSLWFDRAIAYRHQQHFDHALAAMSVVVQQMVFCDFYPGGSTQYDELRDAMDRLQLNDSSFTIVALRINDLAMLTIRPLRIAPPIPSHYG